MRTSYISGMIKAFGLLLIALLPMFDAAAQNLSIQDELAGAFGNEPEETDPVQLAGWFTLVQGTRKGTVNIRADIADRWHLYSITQARGGPLPARIRVPESDQYKVTGDFEPDADPLVTENDPGFTMRTEKHKHEVIWSAPIEISEGIDPNTLALEFKFSGQTCVTTLDGQLGSCLALSEKVPVSFDGFESGVNPIAKFKPRYSHLLLNGKLRRVAGAGPVKPGDRLTLNLTAEPQDHFHIYTYAEKPDKESFSNPTLIAFTKQNDWSINGPTVSGDVIDGDMGDETVQYHEDPVTWKFNVIVPMDAEEKNYTFAGVMGFQTCTDQCDRPDAVKFTFSVPVGEALDTGFVSFVADGSYTAVKKAVSAAAAAAVAKAKAKPDGFVPPPKDVEEKAVVVQDSPEEIAEMAKLYDVDEKIKYLTYSEMDANPIGSGGVSSASQTTFWTAMLGAFLGGMLLNLMPCVFPVLGLKVMGFVEQAGSEAKKIRQHGIAFTAGLVVSMWCLAGIILAIKLTAGKSINWGAQMGNPYFVASMIVLMFLLGLNMAGVFEIGTTMTRVGGKVQGQKGLTASFMSGILTTLIATPCSGPFLGAAMSYTLAQPALTALFLFTIFALGISMPYLLLSFFPSLINKLPRPGAWMETFKVTMAFAMFAVVAFFMQAFGGQTGVDGLSWIAMALVVIGLAAFFYGKWSLPHIKPVKRWTCGIILPMLIAALGAWMCYDAASYRQDAFASRTTDGVAWQNWNPGKVEYTLAKKKRTVWVDYTADW